MTGTRPATKSGPLVWWHGARPRTLGVSVVPVLVGTAAAGAASAWRLCAALTVAVGLQVGVNYLNDYEDAARGVDTAARAGPARLVATGLASPRAVKIAGLFAIAVAAVAGGLLALAAGWWLIVLGAVCIAGAALYSGGPRPYSSAALGEVSVFVFFGLIATCATAYVQSAGVPARAWWAAPGIGSLAVAILVANNLRDIPTDAAAGKRTLAVRIGQARTRALYRVVVIAGFVIPVAGVGFGMLPAAALLVLAGLPIAIRPLREVGRVSGKELVPVLSQSAAVHLAAGIGLAVGLWIG